MSDVGAGILGFVGMSALAGVLVTAAVTPALAVTGMAANNSIIDVREPARVPRDRRARRRRPTSTRRSPDGSPTLLASFYDENREEVAWDAICQYAKDAAVAGEDPRFYEHGGVDIQGTAARRAERPSSGEDRRAARRSRSSTSRTCSSATASAKATTRGGDARRPTRRRPRQRLERKLKEMRYAIALEKKYSKNEILLGYLNIAAFGGRVYGIESAAQYYFGDDGGGPHARRRPRASSRS